MGVMDDRPRCVDGLEHLRQRGEIAALQRPRLCQYGPYLDDRSLPKGCQKLDVELADRDQPSLFDPHGDLGLIGSPAANETHWLPTRFWWRRLMPSATPKNSCPLSTDSSRASRSKSVQITSMSIAVSVVASASSSSVRISLGVCSSPSKI